MRKFFQQLRKQMRILGKTDKELARKIGMRAFKLCMSGQYTSSGAVVNDVIAYAQPKAIDPTAILAFIKALQPMIEELIAMCDE